jgi:hypothetical protein
MSRESTRGVLALLVSDPMVMVFPECRFHHEPDQQPESAQKTARTAGRFLEKNQKTVFKWFRQGSGRLHAWGGDRCGHQFWNRPSSRLR